MSITIDYFFNYPNTFRKTANDINLWIGCQLEPYEGDESVLYSRLLGMELSFNEHSLMNDRELDFENYRFQLGSRTPLPDAAFRTMQMPLMVYLLFALFKRLKITGLLVYDVQIILARYEERSVAKSSDSELFDSVSNRRVVIPEHIADVARRMPQDAWGDEGEKRIAVFL